MIVSSMKQRPQPLTSKEEATPHSAPEPRWPAFIAILVVGGLWLALPNALTVGPRWLFPSLVLALLIPTIIAHHTGKHHLNAFLGSVPITCDGCKSTLVCPTFSRGFTRYRDTTQMF